MVPASVALVFLLTFIREIALRLQGVRIGRFPPHRGPIGRPWHADRRSFRGGWRVGPWGVVWPGATLTADRDSLEIGLLWGGQRRRLRPVCMQQSEVVAVRRVRLLFGYGVRFETADGAYDGVIFWTRPSGAILEGLRALGWPVSDSR